MSEFAIRLWAVRWTNPTKGFTGEMHNVRQEHLEEAIGRAWTLAGDDGQVEFEEERHEVAEYGF